MNDFENIISFDAGVQCGIHTERMRIIEWLLALDTDGDFNRYLPTTLAMWIREEMHNAK